MVTNLNEREQLDQRVHESPDPLAGIIESAMDAIIAVDDDWQIVLFNAAAERVFACPASEAIGSSIERFIPQRFRVEHSTHVRRFGESGVTNRTSLDTLWGRRATGEKFPIEVSVSKVESGDKKFFTAVIRDIAECHRSEEAVWESERRFQLVADTAPVLMWMSGTDKLCTYFNKPWLDFTGRSLEEELGNGWTEGVHPDDLQRCLNTYRQSFDGREKFSTEYRLRRHDGEYRWILDIGVPRFNEDGSFAGYIGIGIDVTERRRAEEARIRSATMVESFDNAIVLTDVSGTVTDWNKGAERLFGYLASEALGKNISFLAAADHLDETQHIFKKVINGDVVKHHETVRQRKDGTHVEISLTVSPIVDAEGRIAGASGIARDITDRKLAEWELSQSNERLRLAMEAGRVGGWEWDIKSGRDFWFGQKHALLGTSPEVHSASTQEFWDRVHPEDRGWLQDAVQKAMQNHKELNVEFRVVWPDGSLHWLGSQARFFYGVDGQAERMLGMAVDITERKRAEDAIREREVRYCRIIETTNEGVWLLDSKLHNSYVNRQMAEMLGYEQGEMVGRSVFDFYFPEDVGHKKQVLTRRKQGLREQFEERLRRRDGSELWVRMAGTPVFKDNGEFDGALAMVSDITERKRAEETLRESEEKFRSVFREAGVGMVIVSPEGRFLAANKTFCDYLGYTEEELLAKTVRSITLPEDWPAFSQKLSEALTEGRSFQWFQKRCLHKSGRIVYTESSASVIRNRAGDPQYFVGEVLDVTKRKEAEEALRDSEERFRLAAQAGKMYAYEWDVTTDVLVRSPEYVKILGFTEPIRFTRQQFLDKIHPDDRPRFIAATAELNPANPIRDVTYRVLLPSGAVVWLKNSGHAFFDREGRMLRVIGMVTDVTDQKLAEEALSGMTRKLVEAQEQERARIARELHDDINQRLAMLALELGQIQENRSDLPPDVLNRMHELRQQTTRISADVQALSHDLHSSQLEYLGVVAGLKSWCKEFAERQGMQLDCTHDVRSILSPEVGLCLFRVVQEALHNAAKHSGVKRIEVQLAENSGEIRLIIRDLGKGFDVETARQGRGLGLTSMQERVRLVNGSIEIQSKPMAGTTIHVRVPLESERGSQRAAV